MNTAVEYIYKYFRKYGFRGGHVYYCLIGHDDEPHFKTISNNDDYRTTLNKRIYNRLCSIHDICIGLVDGSTQYVIHDKYSQFLLDFDNWMNNLSDDSFYEDEHSLEKVLNIVWSNLIIEYPEILIGLRDQKLKFKKCSNAVYSDNSKSRFELSVPESPLDICMPFEKPVFHLEEDDAFLWIFVSVMENYMGTVRSILGKDLISKYMFRLNDLFANDDTLVAS